MVNFYEMINIIFFLLSLTYYAWAHHYEKTGDMQPPVFFLMLLISKNLNLISFFGFTIFLG